MDRCSNIAYVFITMLLWKEITLLEGKEAPATNLVTPNSIFPCLDSFTLLVTTPNLSSDKFVRLIRVYTSQSRKQTQLQLDKLNYIREYKLPENNLLNFQCHFFSSKYKYYCFVYIAITRSNGAVFITGKPHCRPTTLNQPVSLTTTETNSDISPNEVINWSHKYQKLRPAGPSFKFDSDAKEQNLRINFNQIIKEDQENSQESIMNVNDGYDAQFFSLNCECNQMHELIANQTTVITLDVLKCNNLNSIDDNNVVNSIDQREDDNNSEREEDLSHFNNHYFPQSTICVLNLSQSKNSHRVKILVEKSGSSVIYVPSLPTLPHLIVRDGRLAIDPQLDIHNYSLTHTLTSQYIRVESSYQTNLTLKFILWKPELTESERQQHHHQQLPSHIQTLLSLSPIHYTSLALIAIILLSLVVLIIIALTAHQRKRLVRIVTPSEGGRTSVSYLERCSSLSQFELDENDSLEMDYYDYHNSIEVPKPTSISSEDNLDSKSDIKLDADSPQLNQEKEETGNEKCTNE